LYVVNETLYAGFIAEICNSFASHGIEIQNFIYACCLNMSSVNARTHTHTHTHSFVYPLNNRNVDNLDTNSNCDVIKPPEAIVSYNDQSYKRYTQIVSNFSAIKSRFVLFL